MADDIFEVATTDVVRAEPETTHVQVINNIGESETSATTQAENFCSRGWGSLLGCLRSVLGGRASNNEANSTSDDPITHPGNDGASATLPIPPALRQGQLVELYKAAVKGNWKLADKIIERDRSIAHDSIMAGSYTALQVAAGAQHLNFVKMLMPMSTIAELSRTNDNGNNAFCIAASAGSVDIAKVLLARDPTLLTIPGNRGMLPLYFAAWFGHEEMVKYLYPEERRTEYSEEDLSPVFFACIESGLFGFATTLLESHHTFALKCDGNGKSALHLLAERPSTFAVGTPARNAALKLLDALLSNILEGNTSISTSEFQMRIRRPSHVLFDAVKSGNSEFVVKLIDVCPGLIWETDDKNWSIIHAAVSYRDATIFNLVHEIGFFKDVIVDFKDSKNGDTLLHLAARLAPASELNKLPGAAFQMQRELLWFEEVKKTTHAAVTEAKNGVKQISQEGNAANVGSPLEQGGNRVNRHYEVISLQQGSIPQEGNAANGGSAPELGGDTHYEVISPQHGSISHEGNAANGGSPPELGGDIHYEVNSPQQGITSQEGKAANGGSAPELGGDTHHAVTSPQQGITSPEGNAPNGGSKPELGGDTHYEATSSQQGSISQEGNVAPELGGNGTPQEGNTRSQLSGNPHEVPIPQRGYTLQLGDTLREGNATASQGVMSSVSISLQLGNTLQEGITPQELFTSEHESLLKEGRKWMNGTSKSCTIVSTLIAGALFAAGITVTLAEYRPNEETKHTLKKTGYRIFIISNAMAFLSALAATLTFLDILTSRYAERDFLKSLPFKLIMGLGLLFFSIIAMMVTFSAAFIIAYGVKDFLPVLVIGCAVVPVLLYVYLQLPLLKDIFNSIFSSKYLFRN